MNQQLKFNILKNMLDEGLTMIHFDSRYPEVVVPGFLKNGEGGYHPGAILLNFSYRFGLLDLLVTEEYIEASLSFQGEQRFCHIPLKYIWGLSHPYSDIHQVVFFEDDCPKDILNIFPMHSTVRPEVVIKRWESISIDKGESCKKKKFPFKVINGGKG